MIQAPHMFRIHSCIAQHSGGIYGITSSLTLDSTFDAVSANLQEVAQSKSLWQPGDGDINFQKVFGDGGDTSRLSAGMKKLEEKSGKPENSEDVRKLCQYLSGKILTLKILTKQLTHHDSEIVFDSWYLHTE